MIDTAHIHKAFDADLEKIQTRILEMAGLVEAQIADSAEALHRRDVDRAAEVAAADRRIDRLEHEIDVEVVRVLALRQPVGQDLRRVIAVMKIAGYLERIGDYAKNNAKRVEVISQSPPFAPARGTLRRMARMTAEMLKDAVDSWLRGDAALALDVRQRDEDVDQIYNGLFRELLTHMMEDARHITPAMQLLFVAKNLERIGDHVTNIAEQVVYTLTGEMPDEDRPRATTTDPGLGGSGAAGQGGTG